MTDVMKCYYKKCGNIATVLIDMTWTEDGDPVPYCDSCLDAARFWMRECGLDPDEEGYGLAVTPCPTL